MLKKIKLLLSFNHKTILLLGEAFLFLGIGRLSKEKKFSKLAPTLGVYGEETDFHYEVTHKKSIGEVANAIHLVSRYTFWESECMGKAIAAMKMLERRNIPSTMYYGTARDTNKVFVAHAWLRSGPFYITGSEVMDMFTVVSTFANSASRGREG